MSTIDFAALALLINPTLKTKQIEARAPTTASLKDGVISFFPA